MTTNKTKHLCFFLKKAAIIAASIMLVGCSSVQSKDAASENQIVAAADEAKQDPLSESELADKDENTGNEDLAKANSSNTNSDKKSSSNTDAEKSTSAKTSSDGQKDTSTEVSQTTKESKETESTTSNNDQQTKDSKQPNTQDQPNTQSQPQTQPQSQADSQPTGQAAYGRILFVGDSRTVDIFDSESWWMYGEDKGGVTVYCKNAGGYDFFVSSVEEWGVDNFDTLICWMGCNDRGYFGNYENYYNYLLGLGKKIVLCTVGPTDDAHLVGEFDQANYVNSLMISYNNSLWNWASANGVKVIDLYSYLDKNPDIYVDPNDGIHYQPQPTTAIWYYIFGQL
jgi:hypothetical protein